MTVLKGGLSFPASVFLLRCALLDVRSHPVPVWIAAGLCYSLAQLVKPLRPAASVVFNSWAHRILQPLWGNGTAVAFLNRRIEKSLAKACRRDDSIPSMSAPSARCVTEALAAGLVLKAPRIHDGQVREKGVLLLKFNDRIEAFHRSVNMAALLQHYLLVLEPSWTGYARPAFLAFARYRDHPIVVLSPFRGDQQLLESLGSNLVPIELGSGDWVDPRVFRPLEGELKRFDVVMIARWNSAKRLDLLLRALRSIADSSFRVALVAMSEPDDADRDGALKAIEGFGLRPQFEVFENIPPEEVNRILNQSKVNLVLSSQEGGNRALFEGFFAGVPGAVFRNHIGVRVEHFRPETGRLIDRGELAAELRYFRNHWSEFDPRPWALANIAPEVSTRRLNELLRVQSQNRGESWTADIVMKCNSPNLRYYPDENTGLGLPTMADLLKQFPPP